MRRRVLAVLGGLAMAAVLASCAGNDVAQPDRTVPPGSVPTTVPTPTTAPVNYTCTPDPDPLTVDAGKPTVEVPQGDPPTELQTTDITTGDGPVAATGDKVKLQYVGVVYADGTEFDSSWSRNAEPIEVVLGEGGVIPGWEQGIPGMALGGRRQLVIPPDLAYGDQANGKIPANSTLVFVVDLVQVCTPEATTPGSDVSTTVAGGDGATTETTVATDETTGTTAAP